MVWSWPCVAWRQARRIACVWHPRHPVQRSPAEPSGARALLEIQIVTTNKCALLCCPALPAWLDIITDSSRAAKRAAAARAICRPHCSADARASNKIHFLIRAIGISLVTNAQVIGGDGTILSCPGSSAVRLEHTLYLLRHTHCT